MLNNMPMCYHMPHMVVCAILRFYVHLCKLCAKIVKNKSRRTKTVYFEIKARDDVRNYFYKFIISLESHQSNLVRFGENISRMLKLRKMTF